VSDDASILKIRLQYLAALGALFLGVIVIAFCAARHWYPLGILIFPYIILMRLRVLDRLACPVCGYRNWRPDSQWWFRRLFTRRRCLRCGRAT
jgi:hypothetical protein